MLSLLRAILKRIKDERLKTKLYQELDIGEGTRVELSNLDNMFPHLIRIGKNCIFAPCSMVLVHDASYYLFQGEYRVAPVIIGDNCFVGYRAIIMPGVTIGNNVVIGAGSIVTKDIPSDSVAAGVPASVIASLPKYLQQRRMEQMFVPPYVGKQPRQIDQADVAKFRDYINMKIRCEQP